MSFAVFQQLAPTSVVDCSIFASFTGADVNNLVLTRGDRLEVYHLHRRQNRLGFAFSIQLCGRPEAICAFRPPTGVTHLALLFRRSRYLAVLRYDAELGTAQTCGQHVLSTDPAAPEGFQPKLLVDPEQRCLLAHALPERLVVFPTSQNPVLRRDNSAQLGALHHQDEQSSLRAPFTVQAWSQLRLHHVEDAAVLGGYHQPTLACLGQARPSWGGCSESKESSVLIFVLDLVQRSVHLIWASHGLPEDAFRIVPLPPPTSGVLAISPNSVTYLKEHGACFCQALNNGYSRRDGDKVRDESKLDILLADCTAVVLSPTVVLFSIHPTGRLYLAHMVLTGRDNVIDIVWTSPGQHLPAWNLCSRDDFVCLADMAGAVSLLRATMSKKKLPGTLQPLKRMRLHEPGEVPLKPTEKLKELMAVHEQLRDVFRFIRSYTFEVADEVSSLGPLQSMQLLEEGALSTQRFIACGGTDSKGALHIMQRAVPLEEQVEFDLPKDVSFGAVWTLRQAEDAVIQGKADKPLEAPPPPHRYVLISGPGKSMLLETTEEIEEISKSRGLDTSVTTVGAGNARGLVVQLTPQRACFMHAAPGAGLGPPPVAYPSSASAMAGSVCDPFVVLGFEDKTMKLLHLAGDTSQVTMKDVSQQLPQELQGPITWASLSRGAEIRLVVLLPTGTLSILHLAGGGKLAVREVFRTSHLADVPPVLRNIAGLGDEDEESRLSASMDYLRPVTDVCAPLPRSAVESHLAKADNAVQPTVLCAELVDLDADDEGPTLVLLVKGRPMLFYRSFVTSRGPQGERTSGHPFPYGFSLVEHDFLGLVQSAAMPYRPVAPLDASGRPNGAVAVAPHAGLPALWLVAKRNQLFIHPLPGKQHRGLAALSAPCCQGLFAVLESEGGSVAQVCSLATVEGLDAFDLKQPVPTARLALKKRPKYLATKPGVIGLAVSDVVAELPDVPAGPSIDEDPLSEDWSIIREPPVAKLSPPPMPRTHPRYELWLEDSKELAQIGRYRFSFDNEEAVLSLAWVSIPGFPQPSLAVGTGVNTGEDLTCRGRLMLFSTKDKEPGILPPMYQRSLKAPVTVVGQSGNHFVHSEGFKFFVEKWENSSFNKLALFDGGICMTSMSNIKNFMLFGDLRKGVDFCQWKEEQSTGTRTIRRLSRSPPSMSMTVLACEFVIHQKSLGLVALDHRGYAHLYQYTPHSDGREGDQLLRSCATFAMGAPCRAALRLQTEQGIQSLFMAGVGGELYCIRPIDDQAYRTITTLLGMLFTRLPFCCGLNPRAFRSDNAATLLTPRKNIEDAVLLRHFAFLSQPLQGSIAEKMRLPVSALMRATAPYGSSIMS
ncbi:unnamed protein product [Effrenium voratum]|uniref:Cleavage and polyadenylation specificity factor subunit 1 n=1 Tax=Effrenium voratum TaxID=2562239 RepID=A0AA36MXC4_9DINO|nr:unnamed protein product [Effrenium voratum]